MYPPFLNEFLSQYQNGMCVIDSQVSGPTITLVAFTHGDEVAGIHVFDFLLNSYHLHTHIRKGKVQLIIGNIEAAKRNLRLVDKDLNRIWDFSSTDSHTYEYKRAQEMAPVLLDSDAVLDLHSTSSPSQPMVLPVSHQSIPRELRDKLHSQYVIYDILQRLHGKALVSFVSEKKPQSYNFALESGQHTEEATLKNAIQNSLHFLSHYDVISATAHQSIEKTNLQVFQAIHAKSMAVKFLYSESPKSFDFVSATTAILHNGADIVHAGEDSYILMPSYPKYIGEEIAYLSKELVI